MTPTNRPHGGHDDARHMQNEEVLHEHSDVNVRAVLTFAVGLAVATFLAAVVVWGLFRYFDRQAKAADPKMSPVAAGTSRVPDQVGVKGLDPGALTSFPEPRLQTNEPFALKQFRATEDATLEQYGWVDEKGGVAHMPIDEAKKLILQRGIPTRADAPTDPLLGTHAPAYGEATGGRALSRAGNRQ